MSNREKNLIKVINKTNKILVAIPSIICPVMAWWDPLGYKAISTVIGGLLSFVLAWAGEEPLIKFLLNSNKHTDNEDSRMLGKWRIKITYPYFDSEGKNLEISRIGEMEIKNSPTGLIIEGGRIIHVGNCDAFEVQNWESEFAECIGTDTFIYAYKIRRTTNPGVYDKVGYAVTTSRTIDLYTGTFVDLKIQPNSRNEPLRNGSVVLERSRD